jgi:uncharacterized protein
MDEKKAVQLLKRYSTDSESYKAVLKHSRLVARIALRIARRVKKKNPGLRIDMKFVGVAALLHDIGRFDAPPGPRSLMHGCIGSDILALEGLDERYQRVCATHLGYWITKAEVLRQKMPIPARSYKPRTIEEKIISYADKLVDYDKEVPFENVYRRYKKRFGLPIANRLMTLHKEMTRLMEV